MIDRPRTVTPSRWREALSWLWASCERVSVSESESLDRDRPVWEQLTVNAHQMYCPGCRRFRKQMRSVSALLRRLRARDESSDRLPSLHMPTDVRERIKSFLRGPRDRGGPRAPFA